MWHDEGMVQGSPTSSPGFSFTIHHRVRQAGRRLAAEGRCAMFGMDDGYMVGPKELIFDVLEQFVSGVKEDTECGLKVRKCKMYIINPGEYREARRTGLILEDMKHLEKRRLQTDEGGTYRRSAIDDRRGRICCSCAMEQGEKIQATSKGVHEGSRGRKSL